MAFISNSSFFQFVALTAIFSIILPVSAQTAEDWQWPTAKPSDVSINDKPLYKANARIRRGKYHLVDSLLVVRHGKLVFEQYYNKGSQTRPHRLASAGKSLLSTLIGIAIDQGVIKSVDEKYYDYFDTFYPRLDNWDERKSTLSLHHLLTMRAGWDCQIMRRGKRCGHQMEKKERREALKWLLDRPMKYAPGDVMQYTDAAVHALDILLVLAKGQATELSFQQDILAPMGISSAYHNALTSRQMAMFGQLFLNKGRWNGKQIISQAWVDKSTSPIYPFSSRKSSSTVGYGYFWWVAKFHTKTGLEIDGYYAAGNGGQYIVVLPELDMVVVITGSNYDQLKRMNKALTLIEDFVLPAVLPVANKDQGLLNFEK